MVGHRAAVLSLLILAGGAAAALAQQAEDGPHVWTREDLERLYGPPSVKQGPVASADPQEEQRRIEAFLDRQYARLDAERELEMRRRQQDHDLRGAERPERMTGYLALAPWAPYSGRGWYGGWHGGPPRPPSLPPKPGWISKPGFAAPKQKPGPSPRLFTKPRGPRG